MCTYYIYIYIFRSVGTNLKSALEISRVYIFRKKKLDQPLLRVSSSLGIEIRNKFSHRQDHLRGSHPSHALPRSKTMIQLKCLYRVRSPFYCEKKIYNSIPKLPVSFQNRYTNGNQNDEERKKCHLNDGFGDSIIMWIKPLLAMPACQ